MHMSAKLVMCMSLFSLFDSVDMLPYLHFRDLSVMCYIAVIDFDQHTACTQHCLGITSSVL